MLRAERRAERKRQAKERRELIIKIIAGITIGTVIGSFVGAIPVTSSYFKSSANVKANVGAAEFKDLIKYSFICEDLQNVKLDSSKNTGEDQLFNEWLLSHNQLNYKIDKDCFIDYKKKETNIYPTDKIKTPKKVINPKSIKIYAGSNLKTSTPVVYFDIEGDIKNYIQPVSPVFYEKNGNNEADININLDYLKLVKDSDNVTGTITIGYLNSYKYEKIPIEFTRQYLLYEFGRELFTNLNIKSTSNDTIDSYLKINDNQKQMIDMISPELTQEIETLINSHNDLTTKFDDLSAAKTNLEKELAAAKKDNDKKIEELNTQIGQLNSEIEKLKPGMTTSDTATVEK